MKIPTKYIAPILGLAMAGFANASTILVSSDFESGLAGWTLGGGASHYIHNTLNQPAPDPGHNYASGGTGAARLPGNNSTITLATTLNLTGYTELTISLSDQFFNGSTTRRAFVQYSGDNGANWVFLGNWDTSESGGNETIRNSSITLTPGSATPTVRTGNWHNTASQYTGSAFTANSLIQIGFNTNNAGHIAFIDDVVISGVIPEPTTALLGGLGLLALLRRRR